MKFIHHSFFLLFVGILVIGCKSTTTSPTLATGDVEGHILPYDSLYSNPLKDKSGFKVSLEGTSYFAISDTNGKWVLKNIPSGTYTIIFSKDHFAIHKEFNLQVVGNGIYYYHDNQQGSLETQMYPLPSLWPNLVLRPFTDETYIRSFDSSYYDSAGKYHLISRYDTTIVKLARAIFSSRSQYVWGHSQVYTYLYFNKQGPIYPLDPNSFLYSVSNWNQTSDTSGIANISVFRSELLQAGFISGDSVNCCAFAGTYNSLEYSSWVDQDTYKIIQSGFSPHHSEIKSFILP